MTTTDAEIIERLRVIASTLLASTSEDWVALAAADRLSELAAAIRALKDKP